MIAEAIKAKYLQVNLKKIDFAKGQGELKVKKIEEMISKEKPFLISLALAPFRMGGWHIMPVIGSSEKNLTLLWTVLGDGAPQIVHIKKGDLISIHDQYAGGIDIAFLDF